MHFAIRLFAQRELTCKKVNLRARTRLFLSRTAEEAGSLLAAPFLPRGEAGGVLAGCRRRGRPRAPVCGKTGLTCAGAPRSQQRATDPQACERLTFQFYVIVHSPCILHSSSEEHNTTVFVGSKPVIAYVVAALMELSQGRDVVLEARGRSICKAVDAAQVLRNRYLSGVNVKRIEVGSEAFPSPREGQTERNVSTMKIVLTYGRA